MLKEFDKLPVNKIALLHEPISGIGNYYLFNYEKKEPGDVLRIIESLGKRYLDEFDYVKFLNNGV